MSTCERAAESTSPYCNHQQAILGCNIPNHASTSRGRDQTKGRGEHRIRLAEWKWTDHAWQWAKEKTIDILLPAQCSMLMTTCSDLMVLLFLIAMWTKKCQMSQMNAYNMDEPIEPAKSAQHAENTAHSHEDSPWEFYGAGGYHWYTHRRQGMGCSHWRGGMG